MRPRRDRPIISFASVFTPFLLVLGLAGASLAGLADDASIQANVAGLFVGEEKVVEGTVMTAQRDSNTVHLHLGQPPQELTVSLIISLMSNFPAAPERYYLGKTVRVGGAIRSFRGVPEMVIRDVADIRVLGDPPAAPGGPAAGTSAAAQESSARQPVDPLGERLRRLEERVQQLEHIQSGADGH